MIDISSNGAGVECVYTGADTADNRGTVFVLELYEVQDNKTIIITLFTLGSHSH